MSGIRYGKTATLYRMAEDSNGDLTVSGTTSGVSCALWRRKFKRVVGGQGHVNQVTAVAFVPSGTDVQRQDQLLVAGEMFSVLNVLPGEDDAGALDHVGLELEDVK